MPQYTTGEMAKLCGVSVRTVQYYDTREILTPSALSEGGRRLYSEEDLQKLKIICFLRSLDLPINSIAQLLAEEDPGSVISLLLQQQAQALREEIDTRQEKLQNLEEMSRALKKVEHFTFHSIGDIAYQMENKKKLRRARWIILAVGLAMDIVEWGTLILWITTGNWIPFAVGLPVVIGLGIWITRFYFRRVCYICPQCHKVFRPRLWEAFWARHTPNTRKVTCTACGHKGFCVETSE